MARRPSKHLREPRPLLSAGFARTVAKADGSWQVQSMSATQAVKEYWCPGCNQRIPAQTPHVVTWSLEAPLGQSSPVDARRHWHTACWERRS